MLGSVRCAQDNTAGRVRTHAFDGVDHVICCRSNRESHLLLTRLVAAEASKPMCAADFTCKSNAQALRRLPTQQTVRQRAAGVHSTCVPRTAACWGRSTFC